MRATMTSTFKTIGLYGRVRNSGVIATLQAVIHYLQTLGYALVVEAETAEPLPHSQFTIVSSAEIHHRCDLLIVVGGDGSLLHAAHHVIQGNIPVLGINRGRLGFLTDIHPADLEKIKAILEGHYRLEERFLLTAKAELHGKILGECNALNEIALIPNSVPHMHEFEIYIDNQFVCSQDADGLIIATPTGSTAYALSGGGPILHPELNAMVIVPMFPHTLSQRPIVISGDSEVSIIITPNNTASPRLTADSQAFIDTPPASHVYIQKKKECLHLVHAADYDYYETLRSKLHWGQKLHYQD